MNSVSAAQSFISDIADAFVGFMRDLYEPSPDGKLPMLNALVTNHRYLYLSLLGILVLIALQIVTSVN